MSGFIRLGTVFPSRRGGLGTIAADVPVAGGVVQVERPLVQIGGGLAITPALDASGGNVLVRLDRWLALSLDAESVCLPLIVPTQAAAVELARDFDRDAGVSWNDDRAELVAWCRRWLAAHPECFIPATAGGDEA